MKKKKVLFVVTSTAEVPTTGKKIGLWIEEFAAPYYFLTEQGFQVTISSPKGGVAPIDPKSTLPDFSTEPVKKFFNDKAAVQQLNETVALKDIDPNEFDAVFYPGGNGPMWDLPNNKESIRIIEDFHRKGKVVALLYHAPAALEQVKGPDGKPLINGIKVTSYSNSEDAASQNQENVPYSLEDMLKGKGGLYVHGEDWHSFAVNDGGLITGQNPASSHLVAQLIAKELTGKEIQ
jgi:putative intracellular protease/amidase